MQDKQSFYKVLSIPFLKINDDNINLQCKGHFAFFFIWLYQAIYVCMSTRNHLFLGGGGDFELKNLEGVPGSRRHSTTSLNDNIEAAKKRYQMLEVW